MLDEFVVMELGAIIGGDGFEVFGESAHQLEGSGIGLLLGTGLELADEQVPGSSLDEADDAVFGVLADDGVDLPVAGFEALLDSGRSFADVAFAGESAAGVIGPVAFAASFSGATQVGEE